MRPLQIRAWANTGSDLLDYSTTKRRKCLISIVYPVKWFCPSSESIVNLNNMYWLVHFSSSSRSHSSGRGEKQKKELRELECNGNYYIDVT